MPVDAGGYQSMATDSFGEFGQAHICLVIGGFVYPFHQNGFQVKEIENS